MRIMPTMLSMRKTSRTQPARMVAIRIPAEARQQLKVAAALYGISIGALVAKLARREAKV